MQSRLSRQLFNSQREPSFQNIRELRKILDHVARVSRVPQSIKNGMLLCFSEAANNIVEHGKNVNYLKVELRSSSEVWQLILSDNGEPYGEYANIGDENLDPSMCLAEGGRGMGLMTASCDQILYRPNIQLEGSAEVINQFYFDWHLPSNPSKPRLLVVDDEPALRRLYQVMLEEEYEIVCAASGREALELVDKELFERSCCFDLIISDISMPELDGIGLREKLINKPGAELTPFIFLTMAEDEETNQRANCLGIDDYLSKPVSKDQLLKTLHRSQARASQLINNITQRLNNKLSNALIPQIPKTVFGWRLAFAQRGSGVGGGDLVLLDSRENAAFLVLIDIMGHDESAKFFAHAYGGYIRGILANMSDDVSPGQVLNKLSNAAYLDNLLQQTTLSCIVLKFTPGNLFVASAAHPEPLVIGQEDISAMNVGGVLPGLLEDSKYEHVALTKEAASRICFYTDGLFESAEGVDGRKNLKEQLSSIMYQTKNRAVDESLSEVMAAFDQSAGSPPADDTTVLMVEAVTTR